MDQQEWVSLGEAASLLGVHPTTVRQWADNGDLPFQRTPGGHRRFLRSDLEQWLRRQQEPADIAPGEAQLMMQSALGRARMEVGAGQLEGRVWYERFNEEARQAHRTLGRRLMMLLGSYLVEPEKEESVMAEVREMGHEYGVLSLNSDIALDDSVRAFLFFRDLLTDSVIQMAEALRLQTPSDWGLRVRQVNTITDQLLLALVEAYQEADS